MTINKEHKIMKINFKNVLRTATAAAVSAVLLSSAVACGSKDSDKKSESTGEVAFFVDCDGRYLADINTASDIKGWEWADVSGTFIPN